MQKIALAANKIIGQISPELSLSLELKNAWSEIVGRDLNKFTEFETIKSIAANKISLVIRVINSAVVLLRYNESRIVNNISNITGYAEVRLIYKQVYSLETRLKRNRTRKPIVKLEIDLQNVTLKSALEILKTEMQNAA